MAIPISEWMALLRSEYLADFIANGGAAVKFAVTPAEELPLLQREVTAAAGQSGYLVMRVDAARTKIHMIDRTFHAVARQVDWDGLAERWLRDRLRENGIFVDDGQPLGDMDAIARENGRLKPQLYGEINRLIENGVLKDYAMCKEFRTAMTMLCTGLVNPQNVSPSDAEVVKQWLVGDKCNLTALKRMQIYQRIGRHNARLLLGSLAVWAHRCGYPGLVLLLDIDAVVNEQALDPERLRYTRNTVLDTYEVLRQFIDDTDELAHFLLVVAASPALVDERNGRRNLGNYSALQMRLADDVHDRSRANPLNAMVRLEAVTEGVPA